MLTRKRMLVTLSGMLSKLKAVFSIRNGSDYKVKSFDLIGSREKAVAILNVLNKSKGDFKNVAKEIMKNNKNVKSVLRKISKRKGELRLSEYELIIGDRNTEVVHKEYGCLFKLDPQKVYFSPRESTERNRIANQVKSGETVLVMFSGIAPYAIQILKKQPKVKKVIVVEVNFDAASYAIENIKINKIKDGKIVPILGDVKNICQKFYGHCNRVLMPLPLNSSNFLDVAIKCLKINGGIIHFYSWGRDEDLYSDSIKLIKKAVKNLKKRCRIINKIKVLPYGPRTFKICIDFKVF